MKREKEKSKGGNGATKKKSQSKPKAAATEQVAQEKVEEVVEEAVVEQSEDSGVVERTEKLQFLMGLIGIEAQSEAVDNFYRVSLAYFEKGDDISFNDVKSIANAVELDWEEHREEED